MGLTRYRSNEWYEKHKKPTAKPETRAVQRPSSSSSPQATAQHPVPKKRNKRGTTVLTKPARSTVRSEQRTGSKDLPSIPEAEDVTSATLVGGGVEALHIYHSTPLELQNPFEPLEHEKPKMGKERLHPPAHLDQIQSNSGPFSLASELVVHSPPSDDKEQHPDPKRGLLLCHNLQAISATEKTVSEDGTNVSALGSTKSDCGLETAPNPSLSPLQSRLEEFENTANTNTYQGVLPT